MSTPEPQRWKSLGKSLLARRVELDLRYRNRRTFASAVGLDYRVLYDIESGRRTNYSSSTLRAVERAYRLQAGSIDDLLSGGHLLPLDGETVEPSTPPQPVEPSKHQYEDAAEQHLWETPDLSEAQRQQLIFVVQAMRRAEESPGRERPQAEVREFRRRGQ
ncbi:hypothetical protein ABT294_00895 [Nonomuraea sp. NPDC000554]|uniref:hypothetical protein n=1 Tax=Nonomuraea sp. NPDC000554 TaxID=3154259 RepID=UPI0033340665